MPRAPQILDFAGYCAERGAPVAADELNYRELWQWSVTDVPAFWSCVQGYFGVALDGEPEAVLSGRMPHARWFEGTRVNYVDLVADHARDDEPALIDVHEVPGSADGLGHRTVTWAELLDQVGAFAATLRELGVGPGDRVVGYVPDIPEAVVAFLASASIGAVWASCGQDYSPEAAADRFAQLEPSVLVAADGYRFAGSVCDRRAEVARLADLLPSVRACFLVARVGGGDVPGFGRWADATAHPAPVAPERMPFDHPLWILFSSGTTGRPKGIVHGHGGVLLEHLKSLGLHLDLQSGDRYFWFATPSWMVWNYRVSGLLLGATVLCYDGSATYPTPDVLWAIAARHRLSVLGASPAYLAACRRADARPAQRHDLSALRIFGSSGSPLPASANTWLSEHVGEHVEVHSGSGGTDVASGFVGGTPTVPVQPGEISGPCLGVAIDSWDPEGRPVRERTGELVITQPLPSMPLHFWDDPDDVRYRDAYFSTYPGVWRHGDWITITDRGSVVISGRSDSTLNRHGVRIGSAEIYHAVESVPEVIEALVIGAEQEDGEYWMPLFVRLADEQELTDEIASRTITAIRENASPRHVPDDVVPVDAIPHTVTGKKLEVPVKRLLQGIALKDVADPGSVDRPEALAPFVAYRAKRLGSSRRATPEPPSLSKEEEDMTENTPHFTGYDVIDVQYRAIEEGDMDTLRTCFTPDAVVWHANDQLEQDIDTVVGVLGLLGAVSSKVSYEDRRRTTVDRHVFLQHTLTAQLLDGAELRLPAMMHAQLSTDGRLRRIEEYYDSRAADVLAEPFARLAAS